MSNIDVFSMAIRNLFKRKLRTFLTIFGVIIGVVAIVLMISLGIGVNMSFEKSLEDWGDLTLINLYNYGGSGVELNDDMIKQIDQMEGVVISSPMIDDNLKFVAGRYTAHLQVVGIRPEALEELGFKLKSGETLHNNAGEYEIIFGSQVLEEFKTDLERRRESQEKYGFRVFYGGGRGFYDKSSEEDLKNDKIDIYFDKITASYQYSYGEKKAEYPKNRRPDIYRLKPVGLYLNDENNWETKYRSFMNINDLKKIQKDKEKYEKTTGTHFNDGYGVKGYREVIIKCKDMQAVETVIDQLKQMGLEDNLSTPMEYINRQKDMLASLQYLLAAIGAVSLFVAAIGIANTMIMSIYERTREIGIMKVIGASIKDIKKLFLTEAALIGLIGGILGLGISYIASYTVNNVGISFFSQMFEYGPPDPSKKNTISYIPTWLSLSALLFASGIGLLSGYFPARRAMKLSALSAIKAE